MNGHGINSSRFVLESTRVRESQDETITDFLRKNHVSQRFIDAIESGYEGIAFDTPLKDFVLGYKTPRGDFYGHKILIKTIMVIDKDYPAWDSYLLKNKKDIVAFLKAMSILGTYFRRFLSPELKNIIKYNLAVIDPEGDS